MAVASEETTCFSNTVTFCKYATRSGLPESTAAGFCVSLSDLDPDMESKIWEKPDPDPVSLFHFGSSRILCGH